MLTQQDITELLSGFYARLALTKKGKDMVLIAELIEQLRPALENEDAYDVWDYLKVDAEKFRNDLCIMALAAFRQHFFELLFEKQFAAVQQLAKTDRAGATKLLRQYFAEALVHFREDFVCLLLKQDFQLDHAGAAWKNTISKVPLLLQETRWVDLYTTFQEIYNDPGIEVKERCLAEVISGQIVLYNFPVPMQAEKYFQRAMELLPGNMVAKRGLGELYLKKGEFQKARELFLEVIGKQPQDYTSYNLVGDTFFDETKIKLAQPNTTLPKDLFTNEEYWYKEGWRINFVQTESCRRLISLYSFNAAILAAHDSSIPDMLRIVEQTEWYPEKKRFRFTDKNYASCFNDVTYYVTCKDLANSYQALGDHAKAEKLFIETIQLQPQLSPAHIDLAYAQIKEEKYEAAKEQLNKALALNKDNYDTWWCLAYYYEKTKKKEDTIKAYQECKRLRPFWSDWLDNFTGNVYYDYQEYELAIPCYQAAMTQNPEYKIYKDNFLLAQQKLADQKEKAGNMEEAIELYKLVAAETNAPQDWNKIGNLYYRYKQFATAAEFYAKAVAGHPEEPVYHENLGLAYKNQGLPDKAEPEFLEAARINTKDGESLTQVGQFYYEQQKYDEASKWYQKAITWYEQAAEKAPGDDAIQNQTGWVYNKLALIYLEKKEYHTAIAYLNHALTLDQNNPAYIDNLAKAYSDSGAKRDAIAVYEQALKANNNDYLHWNALGNLFFEISDFQNALNAYENAIRLRPDEKVLYGNKALAYVQQGRWQDAEQLVNSQLDEDGKSWFIETAKRLLPQVRIDHEAGGGVKIVQL
jgi:tetratricopeptide (TPR) repeat protein